MIVWDAGALIALLRMEMGALMARQLLRAHRGGSFIHAINWLEIYYGFERAQGIGQAERAVSLLQAAGVQLREDADSAFLRDAAHIKANHRLSLADTMGVALAPRLNAPIISTDHHELDAIDTAGLCRVIFIR